MSLRTQIAYGTIGSYSRLNYLLLVDQIAGIKIIGCHVWVFLRTTTGRLAMSIW